MSQTKFESILQAHQTSVYRLAYYMLRDAEEAKDVTQLTFIRAWKSIHKLRNETVRAWLLKTANNLCIDHLRQRKFRGEMPEDYSAIFVDTSSNPLEDCLKGEIQALVREAIAQLPLTMRTPLILRDIEGLSYVEVAEMLQQPLGTVKSNICRGRRMLKKLLHPLLGRD
jgi:RNA polymerase sigma-70 factor (ECF subfamily)